MFYRYIHNALRPFRQLRARISMARQAPKRIQADLRRVKNMPKNAASQLGVAKGQYSKAKGAAGNMRGGQGGAGQVAPAGPRGGFGQPMAPAAQGAHGNQMNPMGQGAMNQGGPMSGPGYGGPPGAGPGMPQGQMQMQQGGMGGAAPPGMPAGGPPGAPGMPPGMPGPPGMGAAPGMPPGGGPPGAPGMGGAPRGRIKRCGFLWLKRKCVDCHNQMEKGWDACPYCNAAPEPQQAPAPAPMASAKTQAFQLDDAGTGNSSRALLGWLVPVRGPQRGELFTLASESLIGTDPACTVVLQDNFMSSRHCEIKAEGGQWILKDLGSTNGTFVNDKRVDRHELVDSDFVKCGQALLKFKCL